VRLMGLSDEAIQQHINAIGFKLMEAEAIASGFRLKQRQLLKEQAKRVLENNGISDGDFCSIEYRFGRTVTGKYEQIQAFGGELWIKLRTQLKSGKMSKQCEYVELRNARFLKKANKEHMQ